MTTTLTPEEITDITPDEVTITDTRYWGEETFSYGITSYGSDVAVISSGFGTEIFALNSPEEAEQYRNLQMAGSMLSADGELTFRAGHTMEDDTVAVREDASDGTRYSIARIDGHAEIQDWYEYPDAIEDACEKAVQLADRLADDGDEINHILGLHMHTQIHEHRARAARYRTGEAIRQARLGGLIGRTGQVTVVDLALQLGVSRQVLTNVIAGKDWASTGTTVDDLAAEYDVREF